MFDHSLLRALTCVLIYSACLSNLCRTIAETLASAHGTLHRKCGPSLFRSVIFNLTSRAQNFL